MKFQPKEREKRKRPRPKDLKTYQAARRKAQRRYHSYNCTTLSELSALLNSRNEERIRNEGKKPYFQRISKKKIKA